MYYRDGGTFVAFTSEVKALLALPAVSRRPCLPALNEYFTFQNLFTDRTLFDSIRLLPVGHAMELSPRMSEPARPVPFCDLLQSVIARGVTIGDHVVIGASSFVNRDIPSWTVAAGVPCPPIGRVEPRDGRYQLVYDTRNAKPGSALHP